MEAGLIAVLVCKKQNRAAEVGFLYLKYQRDLVNVFMEANNNWLSILQSQHLIGSISLSRYFCPAYPLHQSHDRPQIKRAGA